MMPPKSPKPSSKLPNRAAFTAAASWPWPKGVDPNCGDCDKAQQGKALVGQSVLRGLRLDGNEYTGGKITDPKTGKVYSAKATVTNGGKSLQVRGFMGVSALGRTQTWQRVQ